MFESLNSIAPFAKSGQVRPLAVTGDHRSPAFPDVPTIAEAGVPGYSAESWTGLIAPAGLPQPIIDKLNAASNKALQSDTFKARIAAIGDDVAGGTPAEFAAFIASESKKWGAVIERAGIKFE
jgi:tripartite-type tricarboxylate transporter receptor subunit TctC